MQNSPAFWGGKKLGKVYVRQGPNVVANCQTNITIYVEVYGEVEGHRFEWEQVAGSAVGITYLTPLNELTLSYINTIPPGVRDDKKFRFWVDKGSSKQEYYDINVFASPVELPKFPTVAATMPMVSSTVHINQASNLNAWLSMGKLYNYSTDQEMSGMFLEWRPPANGHDATTFIKYQPQKYVNGSWVDIGTPIVDHTGTFFIPLVEKNYVYRVLALYKAYKKPTEIFKLESNSTWWVDENVLINPHIDYAKDQIRFPVNSPASVISSILTYSVTNQLIVENITFADLKSSTVSNFLTFVNSNFLMPENLQMLPRQGNDLLNSVLTISVAGNTNIGNIGG